MRSLIKVLLAFGGLLSPFAAQAGIGAMRSASIATLTSRPEFISYQGNPFIVHNARLGENADDANTPPRFLVQGGLHGNEILTSQFVLWLKNRVARGESLLNALPPGSEIDFLPYANPDSYSKSRYNQNRVNLNRNFSVLWGISREPYGTTPFSEPETKAIRGLIENRRYTAAIDVHGYVNWVVLPSDPRVVGDAHAEKTRQYVAWRDVVKEKMGILSHVAAYELKFAGFLGDGGAFEDWAFWGGDALAACLEMAEQDRFVTKGGAVVDTFMQYEKYIHALFAEAVHIKRDARPHVQVVEKVAPKADAAAAKVHH